MTDVIGVSRPRIDAPDKVTGATRYAADGYVHGLLHARLVLATESHALIRGIEREAEQGRVAGPRLAPAGEVGGALDAGEAGERAQRVEDLGERALLIARGARARGGREELIDLL